MRFAIHNRQRSQQLMLVAVFGFVALLSSGLLAMSLRSGTFTAWFFLRVIMGELLVAWLSADHITALIRRARESGEWEEWRAIPDLGDSIPRAMIATTTRFILVGLGIWGIIELGVAMGLVWRTGADLTILLILPALCFLHIPAVALASASFLLASVERNPGIFMTWVRGARRVISYLLIQFISCLIFIFAPLGVVFGFGSNMGYELAEMALVLLVALVSVCLIFMARCGFARGEAERAHVAFLRAFQAD